MASGAEETIHLPEAHAPPDSAFTDFIAHAEDYRRYAAILQKVIHLVKTCTSLAMDATTPLGKLKFHVGLMSFTWDMGTLHRDK